MQLGLHCLEMEGWLLFECFHIVLPHFTTVVCHIGGRDDLFQSLHFIRHSVNQFVSRFYGATSKGLLNYLRFYASYRLFDKIPAPAESVTAPLCNLAFCFRIYSLKGCCNDFPKQGICFNKCLGHLPTGQIPTGHIPPGIYTLTITPIRNTPVRSSICNCTHSTAHCKSMFDHGGFSYFL